MPELPEVEITRRRIAPLWLGKPMDRVVVGRPSHFFLTKPPALKAALQGQVLVSLDRVGKYLVGALADGSRLVLHLGMTGQLFSSDARSPHLFSAKTVNPAAAPGEQAFAPDQHTHLQIELRGATSRVYFRDVRRFGRVEVLAPGQPCARLTRLGPDALSVTSEVLQLAASRRSIPVKSFLLDQTALAGVGNIYADEALFRSRIKPTRPASELGRARWEALAVAVREILERALEVGGSTISDFVHPDGEHGQFQLERQVYAREDQPCFSCGTSIRRVVIAQRSAHYCPHCQR